MSLITCENLRIEYEGVPAVTGVSFCVERGDYLCIVGENGSGKSSLLKCLLGLHKQKSGRLEFAKELKESGIGYLPQQTAVQKDFPISVYEVVLSGCLKKKGLLPFYGKRLKETAYQNMKRMKILELKNKCYRDLSGGQQQRVLLARALCAAGDLLILDEPVTGLDPVAAKEMYELIRVLNKEYHMAVLMVSHDIARAVEEADKILHLDTEMLFFGEAAEYKKTREALVMLGGKEHD